VSDIVWLHGMSESRGRDDREVMATLRTGRSKWGRFYDTADVTGRLP